MRIGGPGRQIQCDRDHLAPEIGGYCGRKRVTPPGVADQLLASSGQANKRLDTAWIVCQRSEKPSLCLGREIRPQLALERSCRAGKTFVERLFAAEFAVDSSDFLLKEQDMQLSRDPPDDLAPRRFEFLGTEFVATGPDIFGGRGIADPDINAQHPRTATLGAPSDKIFDVRLGGLARLTEIVRLVRNPLQ